MLGNAAVAALLAVVALAVAAAVRSPTVRHAAWVIVLLKFVTPPLFDVPLRVLPASWETPPAERPDGRTVLLSPSPTEASRPPSEAVAFAPAASPSWPGSAIDWLMVVWVAGAVVWFGWQGRRVVRFRRRVRGAEDAPAEVVDAVRRLAAALGIVRPPAVKLATGIGSPMLWGWGSSAVVLFPR